MGVDTRTKPRLVGTRVRTSAGFEGEGTEGKDVGGEAGLEERGFVGRYSGGGRLGRSSHRSNSDQISGL